jgi:hypothetical protein
MNTVTVTNEVYAKGQHQSNSTRIGQIFARKGSDEDADNLRALIEKCGGISLRFDGQYNKENETTTVMEFGFRTGDRIVGLAETKKTGARAPIAWCVAR